MFPDENELVNSYLLKINLKDGKRLMEYLQRFVYLTTGRADVMFCNAFINESIRLLINSIRLYEEGFFDCAFYSVRQAVECTNNMLYLANSDEAILKSWRLKEHFPPDNRIKDKLQKIDTSYKEVYSILPSFFDTYEDLLKRANKIIHKQGFNAFYSFREIYKKKNENTFEEFFEEFLIYAIARTIIMYIILDPLSLALCDERLIMKIPFMPMTEPIDIDFFTEFLSKDIIDKLKETEFYNEIFYFFNAKEELNPETFDVLVNEFYDLDKLHSIELQRHLLNAPERFFLDVLQHGIKIKRFFNEDSIMGYITSDYTDMDNIGWKSGEYDAYKKEVPYFNMRKNNCFISTFKIYDDICFFEHDMMLNEKEVEWLNQKIFSANEELKALYDELH